MPSDWLGERAGIHPHRLAVVDAASGRQHTFLSFDSRANQIAHFYEQWVGLVPGDRVGLLCSPGDDLLQLVVAAGKLGVTALLLDPNADAETVIAALEAHGPRTAFYAPQQAERVREIWFEVSSVEHFIPLHSAVDTASFEEIAAHYPPIFSFGEAEEEHAWVHFAAEEMSWSGPGAVPEAGGQGGAAAPLYRPAGLAAALRALRRGQAVVIEPDRVKIIEAPPDLAPGDDPRSPSQRNVPQGRSWLPHDFL
jgi:hypothetical protein